MQCCKPIKQLDASFAHSFSTLLREGRRQKHEIAQILVFAIIFVTDCLQKSEKFKCGILHFVVLNHTESQLLSISSLRYNQSLQFLEPKQAVLNICVSEAKYLFSTFFFFFFFFEVKQNYQHYKEDSTRRVIVHEIMVSGT